MPNRLIPKEVAYLEVKKEINSEREDFREVLQERLAEIAQSQSYVERPDKLRDQVEGKVDQLPDRIETLFRDIELLHQPQPDEGYLSSDRWEDAWRKLLELDDDKSLADAYTDSPSSSESTAAAHEPRSSTRSMEFGERIGNMIGRMVVPDDSVQREEVWADILWGVMSGLCFPSPHDYPDRFDPDRRREMELSGEDLLEERYARMDDLLTKIERRGKGRIGQDIRDSMEQTLVKQVESRIIEEAEELIRATLRKEDLPTTRFIVSYLYSELIHNEDDQQAGDGDSLRDFSLTTEEVMEAVETNHLVEEQELRDQVAANLNLDPYDPFPERRGKESVLGKVTLESDGRAISCFDVIQNIPLTEAVDIYQLSDGLGNKSNCAKIGFYLAKEIEIQGDSLPGPALIDAHGSPQEWVHATWELSSYGEFVKSLTTKRGPLIDPLAEKVSNNIVADAYADLQLYCKE